ncbi:FtsX-like permease family protein [Clostridium swellfunianum]|uniref:ABC transporter permease n=1 Tax=Clostridium swellfunianum TaxID=1367462 RepID=UPI00202DC83B|nr:FtsX-like permease family protein [Clostridium swellfunianum]MCM0647154.1 FtsX-like permease family protein [Clostridium swellfunianum]
MVDMKNALVKDTFREIKRTLSRFLSIFAIVAIGVAFFAGVKATAPDMKITGDKYFDDYRLMDIRLVSTMGFDDKDIEAIKKVDSIEGMLPSYSLDALVNVQEKDMVLKVMSLPTDKLNTDDNSYINRVKLTKGRLPQSPNECVAEKGKMFGEGMEIGSKLRLSSGTDKDISDNLKENEFTIVGIIETPYYISFDRGTSSIGSGKVNSFIMIPEENFKLSVYTDVFLTIKGARELMTYSDKYDYLVDPVTEALKATGKAREQQRYEEILAEANAKIEDRKKELRDAEDKQRTELANASEKLEEARKQISKGESKLKNEENKFYKTIKDAEAKIANEYLKLKNGEKEYSTQLQHFNSIKFQAEKEFTEAEKQLDLVQAELDKKEVELNNARLALANPNLTVEQKLQIEAGIKLGEKQVVEGKAKLEDSKAKLGEKKKELYESEAKLDSSKAVIDASKSQLDNERKKLEEGKKKAQRDFAVARKKIEDSKLELQKGEQDYEQGKKESDEKIAEGYSKIVQAEDKINEIEKPVWYVLDRSKHADFVGYEQAADRIDAIAQVFPVFFFLIAALVCLTTMARMVDEQRIYIGTLKALGYSKLKIASKYLFYALFASLGGSFFGLLVGFRVFPTVIYNAYGIMYTMPPVITEFNVFYAVLSTALAVLSTVAAAWFACNKELMAAPAVLMRPKAPKAGKRILLERIKFIWSRLNFTQKVTARNIFRYKKRFIMTILGIGGCTALLMAGFGLKDSIVSITSKQFDELYQYDAVVNLKEMESNPIDIGSGIKDYMLVKQRSIDIGYDNTEKSVALFVPEKTKKLDSFITLRNRISQEPLSLTEEGVIITEKLSQMFKAGIGDEIYIKDGETKRLSVRVNGIAENYVSHYVYMTPALYEKLYGEAPKYQEVLIKTTDTSETFEDKLSREILINEGVSSVSFTTGISKDFEEMIGSLDYVILVLIISAGALAFVVLYNLTNVNITERLREIATIKVLGFYDKEVSNYVFRENILLTIIGTIFGLALGIFLHRFIIITTEIDYVMFGRQIKFLSYIYSAVLTILFSALVNFVMHFKLKKINMVESLKSVD